MMNPFAALRNPGTLLRVLTGVGHTGSIPDIALTGLEDGFDKIESLYFNASKKTDRALRKPELAPWILRPAINLFNNFRFKIGKHDFDNFKLDQQFRKIQNFMLAREYHQYSAGLKYGVKGFDYQGILKISASIYEYSQDLITFADDLFFETQTISQDQYATLEQARNDLESRANQLTDSLKFDANEISSDNVNQQTLNTIQSIEELITAINKLNISGRIYSAS
ncbi:hypothetical protein BVY03_05245 [bacterium K02(2017)]|nr:hypothetical protein BVY03_05245 [bacterium K02(2017)]